ncbi:MAG: hydantoinase B/oxoprolinase family protein, partial [Pseudomonadota bacterium]
MPATIVETKPRPFNRVDLDPITLDIIENAMQNARYEMDAVLFRTAMSPGIREQHDEFPTTILPSRLAIIGNSSCCSRIP